MDQNALSTTAEDMTAYLVSLLPQDDAVKAGYTAAETIARCYYDGERCYHSNFTLYVDPNYGNCYTYNAKGEKIMKGDRAGIARGLSVAYMLQEDEYLNFIQKAGLRVLVHDQEEAIFPDIQGLNAPGGHRTLVALKKIYTESISTDKNPCAQYGKEVSPYNYAMSIFSTEGCLRSFSQAAVIDKCQCGDPRIPLPLDHDTTGIKFCNLTKRSCVNSYYEQKNTPCHCPDQCRSTVYDTTTSEARWSVLYKGEKILDVMGSVEMNDTDPKQLVVLDVFF